MLATPPQHDGPATGGTATGGTEALWRLAYLISGDRARARAIVTSVEERVATGRLAPARARGEVVALARTHVAHSAVPAGGDRLWAALRQLPRRRRAEIVQRLDGRPASRRF